MKRKVLVMAFCLMMVMSGCSKNNTAETNSQTDSSAEVQETESSSDGTSESEVQETANNDNGASAATEANTTGVYIGADTLTEISMGACVDGNQTKLCSVKMPTNYFIATLSMDANGQSNTMLETNGKLISEVIADGSLENSSEVPATTVITAQGDADNSYTFAIVDSATISVESEKDYAPEGVEVDLGNGHAAYVHAESGQFDVVVVYELNADWTLMIENSGQLKDEMSIEEIGQEFCQLVTPLE